MKCVGYQPTNQPTNQPYELAQGLKSVLLIIHALKLIHFLKAIHKW